MACFADKGNQVIGVAVNPLKIDMINQRRSPIIEEGLNELMKKGVGEGRIRATDDAVEAINNSESSFFCVGTPSNSNGSLDLEYVRRVSANIGNALKSKDNYSVVVVRSTMLPGST